MCFYICQINSLETALQLQMGLTPNRALIDNILNVATKYKSSYHTSVMDILPNIRRYSENLASVKYTQTSVHNIKNIVNDLTNIVKKREQSVSVILTKPPESIFIHLDLKKREYILYDSHPRYFLYTFFQHEKL